MLQHQCPLDNWSVDAGAVLNRLVSAAFELLFDDSLQLSASGPAKSYTLQEAVTHSVKFGR